MIHNYEAITINHDTALKVFSSFFLILSLLVIFFGVSGIIEHKSPEDLASLSILSSSFIHYFEYHALIIVGALSLTFSMYFLGKKS